jgi:TatD DNase family protein
MNYWIDTHAHIYLEDFDADRSEMLDRAGESMIRKVYMPNIDTNSIDRMLEVEERWGDQCISMMGLHPCSVKRDFQRQLYEVEKWLAQRSFAAVGETGTDLYWDKTFWEQQKEAFNIQVNLAKRHQLPVVIHCRETLDETIEIIEQAQDGTLTGVFHCFTGTKAQADRIVKAGFYLGIGGVSTFKNGGLDQVIPHLGLKSILLETDSPYLAPVPHRGKRNEPSYIGLIAERVAILLNESINSVMQHTTTNALNLFKK